MHIHQDRAESTGHGTAVTGCLSFDYCKSLAVQIVVPVGVRRCCVDNPIRLLDLPFIPSRHATENLEGFTSP